MNRHDANAIITVTLRADQVLSLHNCQKELTRLLQFANDIHRGANAYRQTRLVILEQIDDCGSWPWQDLSVFNVVALRDELRRAMVMLRLLIRYIMESPICWVYVARGDCLGAYYEIARSCDRLIIMEQSARVGFPELKLGMFPIGGWLESELRNFPKQFDYWQKNPVQPALAAKPFDRSEVLVHWQNLDLQDPEVQESLLRYTQKIGSRAQKQAVVRDPLISYYQLWLKKPLKSEKRPQPSEQYRELWDLVREHLRKSEPEQMFAAWFIDMAAFYMASQQFLTRLAHPRPFEAKVTNLQNMVFRAIKIDLREARPPIQVVIKLLNQHVPLIFFDESPTQLRRSLELIYGNLEKFSDVHAINLWRRLVSWYAIDELKAFDAAFPVLEFGHQDTFNWRLGDEIIPAWIVDIHADRTIFVELDDKLQEKANWFLLTGSQLLVTPFAEHGVPWSQLIRSWALEELVGLSRRISLGMLALIQELQQGGWGFLGDEFQWERFVTRRLALPAYRQVIRIGRKDLSQEIVEIGPWKLMKNIASTGRASQEILVSRRLSLHFMYLAALIWSVLCEDELLDPDVADVLVSRALGIPADWGRVSVFVETWGLRRCQVYIDQHWGDLAESISSL
ncbi:MAG: enoyl-CoA hydratase/isomerase family protein [Oligoflexus sp.]